MVLEPQEPLTIAVEEEGSRSVLVLRGELDPHTAPNLQTAIDQAIAGGATWIALDLAAIRFIDSSGLRVIIQARQEAAGRGHTFVLRQPSATARRLLEVTGLLDHLEVRD